ncbi:site-specific integrase [Rivularia sp. UHCC 0363]|uniref:site-specific integrase n=1 Tax=Rivularia sp. UHCC 0363 TaxID=3110244 RepID=UPI002B1EA528|nr:site-specific integrase [Rivularia sp. UHCC 0363]MEA5595476.1 site-specific integrase [Rivularia sp. UHCC 0363]
MSKTNLHQNSEVFESFEPPHTTDGSYKGTMKQIEATRAYLKEKFDEEVVKVKTRLKEANIKVGIVVKNGSIQLQTTLPLKPGEIDKKGTGVKQYSISLGIPANFDGLKTAEEEAYELSKLTARKCFEWNDKYLGKRAKAAKEQIKTIAEILPEFEKKYFQTRKRTMKSEHTFHCHQDYLKRNIGLDTLVCKDEILLRLDILEPKSSTLYNTVKTLKVFRKIFDLDIDLSAYAGKPIVQERHLPDDDKIIAAYDKFADYAATRKRTIKKAYVNSWKLWQWCYGMLATYGLRPRELFVNPDIEHWLNTKNINHTWKVDSETKTGSREVLPFYPEWLEKFDLKNIEYLQMLKEIVEDKKTWRDINTVRINCSSWFRRVNVGFDPYDLRHAWAIRAHMNGIPIKAAADNLGHSVEIHTEIYQKWFSLENRRKVMTSALESKDLVRNLQNENQRLQVEIEKLLQENQTLRIK